jgi:hypothetical protein
LRRNNHFFEIFPFVRWPENVWGLSPLTQNPGSATAYHDTLIAFGENTDGTAVSIGASHCWTLCTCLPNLELRIHRRGRNSCKKSSVSISMIRRTVTDSRNKSACTRCLSTMTREWIVITYRRWCMQYPHQFRICYHRRSARCGQSNYFRKSTNYIHVGIFRSAHFIWKKNCLRLFKYTVVRIMNKER